MHMYGVAGWHVLALAAYELAMQNSYACVSARDQSGRLVGCGRLVSDGAIHCWLHDIIVLPEWRGLGVGKRVVTALVDVARDAGIPYLGLFAAVGMAGFYEKVGFQPRKETAPGMYLWFMPD